MSRAYGLLGAFRNRGRDGTSCESYRRTEIGNGQSETPLGERLWTIRRRRRSALETTIYDRELELLSVNVAFTPMFAT